MPNLKWTGSKACKKKYLINPQWLRNVKDRKYSPLRIDILFSDKKYSSIKIVEDGGWHFSNIKNAEQIEHKLKSYLHHREFDLKPMSKKEIEEIIKSKRAIYDLKVDQRINKIGNGNKLENFDFYRLPNYLQQNKNYFKDWID
jgi:beta-1,4-mannosyl-glycoprotein beta-1,4-N-acetylglucosaminyltransferase